MRCQHKLVCIRRWQHENAIENSHRSAFNVAILWHYYYVCAYVELKAGWILKLKINRQVMRRVRVCHLQMVSVEYTFKVNPNACSP